MKRGKPLRRRTALRSDPQKAKPRNRNRKPLPKVNTKRLKKLRAKQFGKDGKREWILSLPSALTGKLPWDGNPMTPAHVGKTRGAGGGPEMMAPLLWTEHVDYDSSMTDKSFAGRYGGRTRQDVRDGARELEREWKTRHE